MRVRSNSLGKRHKRPKRRFLANLVTQEALGKKVDYFNCGHKFCPIGNFFSHKSYFSACIEDSKNFMQTLKDFELNYAREHLNIGGQIICATLNHMGIDDYDLPEVNPLEGSGMHITANPSFGYS